MKLPWLIKAGRVAVQNPLYRRCIRERQALMMRQYAGRHYDYEHVAQQRFWEFWLDRFELFQGRCDSLHFYLAAKQETVQRLLGLARYLGAARLMRDHEDEP